VSFEPHPEAVYSSLLRQAEKKVKGDSEAHRIGVIRGVVYHLLDTHKKGEEWVPPDIFAVRQYYDTLFLYVNTPMTLREAESNAFWKNQTAYQKHMMRYRKRRDRDRKVMEAFKKHDTATHE
jgi:hypothetical protein